MVKNKIKNTIYFNTGRIKYLLLAVSSVLIFSTNALASNLSDGIEMYKSGQYDRAIELLNKAVKEDPENPEPHLWLSKCYEETLQLDKTFPEKKAYDTLKYKQNQKLKAEAEKKAEEDKQKQQLNTSVQENTDNKEVRLNDSFIRDVIAKRNMSEQVRNLKFVDYKTIKKWFSELPDDSESINKLIQQYRLKVRAGLATYKEIISTKKMDLDLLALDIETKNFELSQEKDPELKKLKQNDLDVLNKEYSTSLNDMATLINTPVYENTDPTSYDYYLETGSDPDGYIKELEEKKTDLVTSINDVTSTINELKKSIPAQEKELKTKKSKIDPKLLNTDISLLSENDKNIVTDYNNLTSLVYSNKDKLYRFIIAQNNMIEGYQNINNTIKKIKPDYVFNDPVLPKEEKIQEMPQKPVEQKNNTDKK